MTIVDGGKLRGCGKEPAKLTENDCRRFKMLYALYIPGLDRQLLYAERSLRFRFQNS
ncbi:hypothetical protein Plhal304r1_c010g0039941 [Plasmopara halstedii]